MVDTYIHQQQPLKLPDGIHMGYVANRAKRAALCLFLCKGTKVTHSMPLSGMFGCKTGLEKASMTHVRPIITFNRHTLHHLGCCLFDINKPIPKHLTSATEKTMLHFQPKYLAAREERITLVQIPSPIFALYRAGIPKHIDGKWTRVYRCGLATGYRRARDLHQRSITDLLDWMCDNHPGLSRSLAGCINKPCSLRTWNTWIRQWMSQEPEMNYLHLAGAYHTLYEACTEDAIIARVMNPSWNRLIYISSESTSINIAYVQQSFQKAMETFDWHNQTCHF